MVDLDYKDTDDIFKHLIITDTYITKRCLNCKEAYSWRRQDIRNELNLKQHLETFVCEPCKIGRMRGKEKNERD